MDELYNIFRHSHTRHYFQPQFEWRFGNQFFRQFDVFQVVVEKRLFSTMQRIIAY